MVAAGRVAEAPSANAALCLTNSISPRSSSFICSAGIAERSPIIPTRQRRLCALCSDLSFLTFFDQQSTARRMRNCPIASAQNSRS